MTKKEEAEQRRRLRLEKERERVEALCEIEKQYDFCANICGIDEVGRGPFAGPVMAGAVILPKDARILHINDSKKLSPKRREELYDIIMEEAVSVGIGAATPSASTRSIFCRQPMRRCGRQYRSCPSVRIFF